MTNSKVAAVTPAPSLPGHPERTFKYVPPVTPPDGSIGYDRPLANYSDTSKATYLLALERTSSKLYDTIAFAHDSRHPNIDDPSRDTSFSCDWRGRRHSVSKQAGNDPNYLGFSPEFPLWLPRRSSHEERRDAIPVAPSEVSTLLPYIPPMDTSLPPPSQEWLDEQAKQILAAAHAEFEAGGDRRTPEPSNKKELASSMDLNSQHHLDLHFDYDVRRTFGSRPAASRTARQQSISQLPSAESESDEPEFNLNADTDTDIDEESDDGYNWSTTRICEASPHALADVPRWIIPRKRPSVVISDKGDAPMDNDDDDLPISCSPRSSRSSTPTERGTPPLSSDDEYTCKRQRGGSLTPKRAVKKPKRHSADTPARQGRKSIDSCCSTESKEDTSSSERASSIPLRASISSTRSDLRPPSPPPVSSSSIQPIPPLPPAESRQITRHRGTPTRIPPHVEPAPKSYPCFLDGCTQVCASAGDLQRHQQSLRHCAPSYVCLACGKMYTRPDALKRHLNTKAACKRGHASKLAQGTEEE